MKLILIKKIWLHLVMCVGEIKKKFINKKIDINKTILVAPCYVCW